MKKLKGIGFVVILFLNFHHVDAHDGRSLLNYGFIGCLFSPGICHASEECIDDSLFGSCQRRGTSDQDLYLYHLSNNQLMELEKILFQLATSGYTWRHLYTQCKVMSTLLSYRYGVALKSNFCDGKEPLLRKNLRPNSIQDKSTDQLIDDLIDMLSAKISVSDKENDLVGVTRSKKEDMQKEEALPFSRIPAEQETDEIIENFLRRLSEDDLKVLREFLIKQGRESTYESHDKMDVNESEPVVEKKMDPGGTGTGTITRVVIRYNPGTEDSSDGESENADESVDQNAFDQTASEQNKASLGSDILWSAPPVHGMVGHDSRVVVDTPSVGVVSFQTTEKVSSFSVPTSPLISAGFNDTLLMNQMPVEQKNDYSFLIPLYILCGLAIVVVIAAVAVVILRHNSHMKQKLLLSSAHDVRKDESKAVTGDYQDLCREDMRLKMEEKKPCETFSTVQAMSSSEAKNAVQRNNATTWSEDPVTSEMDISTGHMILSYMEDHLKNKNKLETDWNLLCSYDAEPRSIVAAIEPTNMRKNRYADILPYEHTRVRLNPTVNVSSSDYINASTITDHDPRFPAYIAAQAPLPHTVSDFWQMIWEQSSTTIICLTPLIENDINVCYRYWPMDGSDLYHIYEVRLVSEHHSPNGDYIVRSFCLRNIETHETRTVTQFHYQSWPNLGVPASVETLMDFRRKVNMSYHGRFCPVIVHCSDGAGQTGTYCLIDMVLNRLNKGAKEMDIAATLEHIRDQRVNMVRTKEQFEFCLLAIVHEVESILHISPAK